MVCTVFHKDIRAIEAMPVRGISALIGAGITEAGAVMAMSDPDLMVLPNVGATTVKRIREALAEYREAHEDIEAQVLDLLYDRRIRSFADIAAIENYDTWKQRLDEEKFEVLMELIESCRKRITLEEAKKKSTFVYCEGCCYQRPGEMLCSVCWREIYEGR